MSAHSAAIPPSSASTGSLIIPNWPTTNAGLALKKINQGLQILEGTGDAWVHQKEHFDRIVQDLRSLIKDKDGIYKSLSDSPLRSVTDPKKRRNAAKFHTDVDQLSATVKRTSAEVLTDADREIEDGIIKASLIEKLRWLKTGALLKMLQELQVYSEEKLLQLQSSISALSLEMESDPTAIDRTIPRPFPLQFSSHSNPATLDAVGSTPAPGPSSPSKYAQREAQRRVFHVRNACTPTTSIADPPPPYFNPDSSPDNTNAGPYAFLARPTSEMRRCGGLTEASDIASDRNPRHELIFEIDSLIDWEWI
ncbi:hypothetical protein MIND_00264800 [Mycena indigotica]|uniref:Uncharacterized protein n=1 Tax=Mycena indigotica TaxID=2126181 RepID=A0A8H6WDH6_9AGAR|nr:uncharacterized protein MIND_00264800 [Mycena indigotica]KAF7312511.1 hypothetical protein MIND_00264800 [Mycena indigotica]